jgi:hypothetical protein
MENWQDDKKWSDRLINRAKSYCGYHLIGVANEKEDQKHNTDLITLTMEPVRISVRIRRFEYWNTPEFRGQFTMRSKRPNGTKTELLKVRRGLGDYFFYAFADESGTKFQAYTILDLEEFREWHSLQTEKLDAGQLPGKILANLDGSSEFSIYEWNQMPPEAIVASTLPEEYLPKGYKK